MGQDIERVAVDRRDFIKRAGVVAWTVPAIQVANMTGALAGTTNTSVTTSTTPPVTRPGDCVDVEYRLKADWQDGGWVWVEGEGANDCLVGGDWTDMIPTESAVTITGDPEMATVTHDLDHCEITQALHKEANDCVEGEIGEDGAYATFTAVNHGISHVELIITCCVATV